MFWSSVAMTMVCLYQFHCTYGQDCTIKPELQSSLRQVQKLLATHEASYLQSLRNLRKKLSQLQTAALRPSTKPANGTETGTCPKLDTPANGRKLGRVQTVGHEVHFLCEPGYELLGSETRVCQESLTWSGQQPTCRIFISFSNTSAASLLPVATTSPFVRPARCTHDQGSTHCTCESGYTITGRDSSTCTDIDECELFHMGQAGRLCLHTCVNTAGGYRCTCPPGYNLSHEGRSCKDIDECGSRLHSCSREQVCVNTYGGFQCMRIDCPRIRNATYAKTSPLRCERNPCPVDNKACAQAPNSVTHHFLSVVSKLSAPRVLFRVSAVRTLGDALRFSLGGRGRRHFTVQHSERQTGQLVLVRPIQGPLTLEAEVEMSELEEGTLLGRYITKVTLFVSQYDF